VERNYEIHDTEMLAIIRGLEEWRQYLEGTRHPVETWTDHKNLKYFRVAQKLHRRQAHWSLYLLHFDFMLHHKPGQSMGKPNALSRQADHGSGQGDNDNLMLLAPELFRIHVLAGARFQGERRTEYSPGGSAQSQGWCPRGINCKGGQRASEGQGQRHG
jgi:hypothetical protein